MPYLIRSHARPFKARDGRSPGDPVLFVKASTREKPGPWVPFRNLPKGVPPSGNIEISVRPISDGDYAKALEGKLEVLDVVDVDGEPLEKTTPVPAPVIKEKRAPKPEPKKVVVADASATKGGAPVRASDLVSAEDLEKHAGPSPEGDAFERDVDASATEPHDVLREPASATAGQVARAAEDEANAEVDEEAAQPKKKRRGRGKSK